MYPQLRILCIAWRSTDRYKTATKKFTKHVILYAIYYALNKKHYIEWTMYNLKLQQHSEFCKVYMQAN